MILQEGTLQFDFAGAVDAYKFDEQDPTMATFHGLSHCMKAVDFVVEYVMGLLLHLLGCIQVFARFVLDMGNRFHKALVGSSVL
jgi:hypothetical protein